MPIQVHGVLVHAMSGTELSRVRTAFRLRLPEPINKSPLESRGPTLLCNHVDSAECVLRLKCKNPKKGRSLKPTT
jgi:hypothetical protein